MHPFVFWAAWCLLFALSTFSVLLLFVMIITLHLCKDYCFLGQSMSLLCVCWCMGCISVWGTKWLKPQTCQYCRSRTHVPINAIKWQPGSGERRMWDDAEGSTEHHRKAWAYTHISNRVHKHKTKQQRTARPFHGLLTHGDLIFIYLRAFIHSPSSSIQSIVSLHLIIHSFLCHDIHNPSQCPPFQWFRQDKWEREGETSNYLLRRCYLPSHISLLTMIHVYFTLRYPVFHFVVCVCNNKEHGHGALNAIYRGRGYCLSRVWSAPSLPPSLRIAHFSLPLPQTPVSVSFLSLSRGTRIKHAFHF